MTEHKTCKLSHSLPFVAALLMVPAALVLVDGQPVKTPLAKVTLVGKEVGVVVDDAKAASKRFVLLETDAKTTIKVATNQDVGVLLGALMDKQRKLTMDFTDNVRGLIQLKDFEKLAQAEKDFKAASEELLGYLGYYAVDGTLVQVNDTLEVDGKLRLVDYKDTDKALAKGKALVLGEPIQIKGKDDKMTLAIYNGAKPILVTGKAAEDHAKVQGTIRVYGVLRAGSSGGNPVVEAEKIDKVPR